MADQFKDILSQLKDHEQDPPGFLFDQIHEAVKDEMHGDTLEFKLKGLGEYEISPEESHYISISKSFRGGSNNVRTLFYRLGALAAVLFFFLAAWGIYRMAWNHTAEQATTSAAMAPPKSSPSPQPGLSIDIAANATDSNTGKGKSQVAEVKSYRVVGFAYSSRQPAHLSGTNEPMTWVENDLLYSVLNCNYNVLAPYFEDNSRQLVVDVDRYSSATVSDKMMQFMKTLYRTNRKSKPTVRARKAKRKLEKWKKADAAYFDKPGNNHNPLDIIDLTRFAAGEKEKETENATDN